MNGLTCLTLLRESRAYPARVKRDDMPQNKGDLTLPIQLLYDRTSEAFCCINTAAPLLQRPTRLSFPSTGTLPPCTRLSDNQTHISCLSQSYISSGCIWLRPRAPRGARVGAIPGVDYKRPARRGLQTADALAAACGSSTCLQAHGSSASEGLRLPMHHPCTASSSPAARLPNRLALAGPGYQARLLRCRGAISWRVQCEAVTIGFSAEELQMSRLAMLFVPACAVYVCLGVRLLRWP